MAAGNHVQYGEELRTKLTGYSRNDFILLDDYLFIVLDTFAGNLDPTEHSDGTYTGADVDRIKVLMAKYPDTKVILSSHFFDISKESEAFRELCSDDRIICLFCGHNHRWAHATPSEFADKNLIFTGNFSYNGVSAERPMCVYRKLIIDENTLTTRYIVLAVTLPTDEGNKLLPYEVHDEIVIKF